jgi:hypothetical protein
VPRPRLLKAEGGRGREGLTLGGDKLVVVSSMASVMGSRSDWGAKERERAGALC